MKITKIFECWLIEGCNLNETEYTESHNCMTGNHLENFQNLGCQNLHIDYLNDQKIRKNFEGNYHFIS